MSAATPDIALEESGDRVIAEAQTPAGEEFIDGYMALDYEVLDSGRISLPRDGVFAFTVRAREARLVVAEVA